MTAARSRPAACPTCCPVAVRSPTPPPASTPPPPGVSTRLPETAGRDADPIVAALVAGELGGLVVGGVDPDDTSDPAATRAAIEAASFVVALELRETDVTRAADVVFPVAPVVDKAGIVRHLGGPSADLRRGLRQPELAARPAHPGRHRRGAGPPAGLPDRRRARAEMEEMGPWDGDACRPRRFRGSTPLASSTTEGLALSTWKLLVDNGSMQDGDKAYLATGRAPVARSQPHGVRRRRADRHPHR